MIGDGERRGEKWAEASGVRACGRLRAGRGRRGRRGRDELVTGRKESRREGEKGVGDGRGGVRGCIPG